MLSFMVVGPSQSALQGIVSFFGGEASAPTMDLFDSASCFAGGELQSIKVVGL